MPGTPGWESHGPARGAFRVYSQRDTEKYGPRHRVTRTGRDRPGLCGQMSGEKVEGRCEGPVCRARGAGGRWGRAGPLHQWGFVSQALAPGDPAPGKAALVPSCPQPWPLPQEAHDWDGVGSAG